MAYIHKESMEATIFRSQQPWGPCHPRPQAIHKVATKSLSSWLGSTAREQEAATVTANVPKEWDRSFPSFPGKTKWDEPAFTLLQGWDLVLPHWDFRHQVNLCDFKSLLNLLQYCFCLCFGFFGREACGTLSHRAGIQSQPLHWEAKSESLDCWRIPWI